MQKFGLVRVYDGRLYIEFLHISPVIPLLSFGIYDQFRVITGKSKLSDRVAFWTRQSSIKNKVQETGSDVKEEPIFRRQGSVRDLARQFGSNRNSIELNQKSQNSNSNNSSFQRNSFIRKSWCVSSKGNL